MIENHRLAGVMLWCAGFILTSWPSWGPLAFPEHLAIGTGLHGAFAIALFGAAFACRRVPEGSAAVPPSVRLSMLLFLVWCGLSLFWTRADDLLSATGYWVATACEVVAVQMLLARSRADRGPLQFLKGVVVGATCLSLAALLAFGNASGRLGDETLLHPNLVAHWAAIGVIVSAGLVISAVTNRVAMAVAGLFLSGIIVATFSKTVLIALAAGMCVYWAVLLRRRAVWTTSLLWLMTAAAVGAQTGLFEETLTYISNQEKVETLSGRTVLWQGTWDQIADTFWFGNGYLSFRDVGPQVFDVRVVHAHNELLSVWFTLGLVGVLIVAIMYAAVLVEVVRALGQGRRTMAAGTAALLVYCVVRGLTEASTYATVLPFQIVMAFCAIGEGDLFRRPAEVAARRPMVTDHVAGSAINERAVPAAALRPSL